MSKTQCEDYREAVAALVLGELDTPTSAEVRQHLESCQGCRSFCEALEEQEKAVVTTFDIVKRSLGPLEGEILHEFQRQSDRPESKTETALSSAMKGVRHMIASHKKTSAAAAAALLVAAGLLIVFLGPGASLSLAAVEAATIKKPWIHVQYDGGPIREEWVSLQSGKVFCKKTDGELLMLDFATNVRLQYAKRDNVIYQDVPTIYPNGEAPAWKPRSAWEYVIGRYDQASLQPRKPDAPRRVERAEETVDGTKLIRFDMYYRDAAGRELLLEQLWADTGTRLPVRSRRRLQVGERTGPGAKWVTGKFSFPDRGPDSLYSLGVPRNAKLVNTERTVFPADVKAVMEAAQEAVDRFPKRYRAVIWSNDRTSEIDVVHRNGDKFRRDRYFNFDPKYPAYHLPLPASASRVLAWILKQAPMSRTLFVDGIVYSRSNPYPAGVRAVRTKPRVRMSNLTPEEYFRTNLNPPVDYQWPFLNRGGPAKVLKSTPETPAGCIALRFESGMSRHDYYLDPQRGYICVKNVQWRKVGSDWRKMRENWLFRFERVSRTSWYATKKLLIDYGDRKAKISRYQEYRTVDIEVLKEGQFPPNIFDGQELRKGAKVEAY